MIAILIVCFIMPLLNPAFIVLLSGGLFYGNINTGANVWRALNNEKLFHNSKLKGGND